MHCNEMKGKQQTSVLDLKLFNSGWTYFWGAVATIGDTYNLNGRGDSIGIVGSTIVLIVYEVNFTSRT